MKRKKKEFVILKPRLPKRSDLSNDMVESFGDEDIFYCKIFENCTIEDQNAEKVSFKQVLFRNVDFKKTILERVELEDVRFENCDLSNIELEGAIIHRAEFENCKMVGVNLSGAAIQNTVLDKCNCKYANIRFSLCKRFEARDSILDSADFQSSEMVDVRYEATSMRECQMSGTSLCGIDISTCDIEDMIVRMEDIKGAIVSPLQAVMVAGMVGVVVKDI
ncbi:MAG TPA: pentapeptide repeat-containing protein [Clostridia bacterium]|nr:pentapeptide repeat-containing protein [Clostridia bacterium]